MQNMFDQTIDPAVDKSTPAAHVETEREAVQSVSI